MPEHPDPLLPYRVDQLEKQLLAIHEQLRADYLDRDQLMNSYVTRHEQAERADSRRRWPVDIAAVVCGACAIGSLILQAVHP